MPSLGGVAAAKAARNLSDAHLRHCLSAGIKITGTGNAKRGVWSYKLGPCSGVDAGDQLWMSRHFLLRLSEAMGIPISFDPARSGCFFKYSTEETRRQGSGLAVIQQHLGRLQATHMQHVMAYGQGSLQRLMGQGPHPCSGLPSAGFTCSIGNKGAHVVVPTTTAVRRAGYYIDRRPASNVDPYTVTMLLVSSTLEVPLPCAISAPAPRTTTPHFLPINKNNSGRSTLSGGSRAAPSCSWGCSSRATSMNTEDVLIDELDRIDAGEH